ncbi:HAD hydrolase family protein [Brevibacillus humidisoli]|uniref:5' nucleotidase, NT5C type n=1 Tax=Brevibacillus humidisoli TaxID=2895522 RepID=UPI001E351A9B|nr:HAD hydrolase family protein [Brevibacillus humidisoli]UFJ42456.1 HAD hydrolase family protein [Brevibacillus humidisoli]
MRIVIDLDGTICQLKGAGDTYETLAPVPGAVEAVKRLKQAGHEIVIHTARNMKTQRGKVTDVIASVGQVTLDWLDRHGVPYDEVVFGKPYGDVYIDDLAIRFCDWQETMAQLAEWTNER